MLTIRAEQMKAFEAERLGEFRQKLLARIADVAPQCPDPERQIERTLQAGPEFGLFSERDLATFAEIICRFMGGFPDGRLPKGALAILMTYGQDPRVKLKRFHAWAEKNA